MSAAIVKKWFEDDHEEYHIYDGNSELDDAVWLKKSLYDFHKERGLNNYLTLFGWDHGDAIPDLSIYDRLIMVDISFPKEEMSNLFNRVGENLIWIDHHISTIKDSEGYVYRLCNGLRDTNCAACELTWKYFFPNDKMPEIVRLLGKWDNMINIPITDKDKWLKVTKFQYGARAAITDYKSAYIDLLNDIDTTKPGIHGKVTAILNNGKEIYKYLQTEAEQIYSKSFPIIFDIPELRGYPENGGEGYKFLCVNQERFNPINFGIDYHKDGYDGFACFWYKNGKWNFSLYNDDGKVDCSSIARQYDGGGHKGAAGFTVDNINEIIKQ